MAKDEFLSETVCFDCGVGFKPDQRMMALIPVIKDTRVIPRVCSSYTFCHLNYCCCSCLLEIQARRREDQEDHVRIIICKGGSGREKLIIRGYLWSVVGKEMKKK